MLVSHIGSAQQDPTYTQYMNNIISVNPAYIGDSGFGSATLISRKQWIGIDGSPFTTSLTMNLTPDSLRVGGGFDFLYDYFGGLRTTALFLDYSYRIKVTETSKLSFGLKAGFSYIQGSLSEKFRYHIDDQYIIDYGDEPHFLPNFGVGVFWYGDRFNFGFSVPRLLQNYYDKDVTIVEAARREERHYFIQGTYTFDLMPGITLTPKLTTIMVAGSPVTADLDLAFSYNKTFIGGIMYRISDAVGAYVQFDLDKYQIGFAYDYSHTRISNYSAGTIEFLLKYNFKMGRKQYVPIEDSIEDIQEVSPE